MAVTVMNQSGQEMRGDVFRFLDLSSAQFRRAVLTDFAFEFCDLSKADFRNAQLTRTRFENCQFIEPNFAGAQLDDCNIEVIDGRLAGRGYVAIASQTGLQIGCAAFSWAMARDMCQRDLLRMDRRDAVAWWERFGAQILHIGRRRQWV